MLGWCCDAMVLLSPSIVTRPVRPGLEKALKLFVAYGAAFLGVVAPATGAAAALAETWVSNPGTDSGTCALAAPCATFRYAATQTASGGAIHVANSGSYGVVTLNRAVSILAPDGVEATIAVPAKGTGITVNAGAGVMVLRGIHITGQVLNGNFGITVNSVGSLTIDHDAITNTQFGIYATNGFVMVKSTLVDGNSYGVANYGDNMYMGQSTISGNAEGIVGSAMHSYGDNDMNGNTECDVCATINPAPHDQ